MKLTIPDEYQNILLEAVATGAFATPEDALKHALDLLVVENSSAFSAIRAEPTLDWAARFHAWADSHPASEHFVDCSREGVY